MSCDITPKLSDRSNAGEGLDGLRDRTRRPNSIPNATPAGIEDAIVRARKELADAGEFNGPFSIADRLAAQGASPVPSRATIARILARRDLVRPQPRKRPRSSYRRFQAGRANGLQSDWTEWRLVHEDGSLRPAAIAGTLDDHSRFLVGLRAEARDGTTRCCQRCPETTRVSAVPRHERVVVPVL